MSTATSTLAVPLREPGRGGSWRSLWLAVALTTLAGCASDGYVYHEDGYWTARAPSRSVVVYDASYACSPWYDPFGYGGVHPWYPCLGNGYVLGPFYGGGFYALYDPYWPYFGYGPAPRDARSARQQARWLAPQTDQPTMSFTRYEDLAPGRRRDTGGGARAYPDVGGRGSSYPIGRSGLGSSVSSGGRGQPSYGTGRSSTGMGSARGSMGSASPRTSAASGAREMAGQSEE